MSQLVARLPDGMTFDFCVHTGIDRYVSERIRTRGSWEPFETCIMTSLLRAGDVFVDIGANIGWHTIVAALKVGPPGRVYAFEPEETNANLVVRNVAVNNLSNVRLFRCALSEKTGTTKFVKSTSNMGDHRIAAGTGADQSIDVPVDALDRLVAAKQLDLERTRIVKIDTQGAELMVLKGAQNTFCALPEDCALFVEFSPNLLRKHAEDAPEAFIRMLGSLARDIYAVDSRHRTIHPIRQNELRRFAAGCVHCSEDVGLDLILAPRRDAGIERFVRAYSPLVKRRFMARKLQ